MDAASKIQQAYGDAISRLGLAPELMKTMQTNVAVGYAVCYIFGSLGPSVPLFGAARFFVT